MVVDVKLMIFIICFDLLRVCKKHQIQHFTLTCRWHLLLPVLQQKHFYIQLLWCTKCGFKVFVVYLTSNLWLIYLKICAFLTKHCLNQNFQVETDKYTSANITDLVLRNSSSLIGTDSLFLQVEVDIQCFATSLGKTLLPLLRQCLTYTRAYAFHTTDLARNLFNFHC